MDEKTNTSSRRRRKGVRYYLPSDVVLHNKPDDLWVTFLGKVWDITSLSLDLKGKKEMRPLIAFGGKDISHWFDKRTGDIKTYIHPLTRLRVPFCPHGLIPHVPPPIPSATWQPPPAVQRPLDGVPWWRDKKYFLGYLSSKPRPLKIICNAFPQPLRRSLYWVASEEKLNDIMQRLFPKDFDNITMRYQGVKIDMDKSLQENEVPDERSLFNQIGMPENNYVPAIQLYYLDDYNT